MGISMVSKRHKQHAVSRSISMVSKRLELHAVTSAISMVSKRHKQHAVSRSISVVSKRHKPHTASQFNRMGTRRFRSLGYCACLRDGGMLHQFLKVSFDCRLFAAVCYLGF